MRSSPFFIVGCGRSGSTLLRVILASHSRLSIPPETWYLLRIPPSIDSDQLLSEAEVETVVNVMTSHYRWPDMKIEAVDFRRAAFGLVAPRLRDVVELVYKRHLEREEKCRWGDKTPGYIEIIPRLAKLFPDSQFIHLIRDGRDVSRSFQAQGWYGRHLFQNTREWNEAIDFDLQWTQAGFASRILHLRYEDLVIDTERTVRRACEFLEEDFQPQMLSWKDNVDDLIPSREAHIHKALMDAPSPTHVYRWKREMGLFDVITCEAFMGGRLDKVGYSRQFPGRKWEWLLRLTRYSCLLVAGAEKTWAKILRFLHVGAAQGSTKRHEGA